MWWVWWQFKHYEHSEYRGNSVGDEHSKRQSFGDPDLDVQPHADE